MALENFGVNDIITGRGLGVGGFGYGGYGTGDYLSSSALADGTALKTASDCHMNQLEAALNRISAQNLETRTTLKMDEILKGQSDAEFRGIARDQAIQATLVENAKEAASCCCETQKEIIAQGTATRELMNSLDKDAILRDLNRAERQLETSNVLNGIAALNASQTNTILAHTGFYRNNGNSRSNSSAS